MVSGAPPPVRRHRCGNDPEGIADLILSEGDRHNSAIPSGSTLFRAFFPVVALRLPPAIVCRSLRDEAVRLRFNLRGWGAESCRGRIWQGAYPRQAHGRIWQMRPTKADAYMDQYVAEATCESSLGQADAGSYSRL